jgi:hypothetical protein
VVLRGEESLLALANLESLVFELDGVKVDEAPLKRLLLCAV